MLQSHRPTDATLSVTKAARILGVHPNTIRAWSDAGRLRYYRINARGDRRYRMDDLQRFLATAEAVARPVSQAAARRGAVRRRSVAEIDAWPGEATAALLGAVGGPIEGPRRPGATEAVATGEPEVVSAVDVLVELAELIAAVGGRQPRDARAVLAEAASAIRAALGARVVGLYELANRSLSVRAQSGPFDVESVDLPADLGILGRALATHQVEVGGEPRVIAGGGFETAIAIPGDGAPWGVLLAVIDRPAGPRERVLLGSIARVTSTLVRVAGESREISGRLHRADALGRVVRDLGSRLDLDEILAGLVDHAMTLFGADRACVFLRQPDGTAVAEAARNVSPEFVAATRPFRPGSLVVEAATARRPMFAVRYRDDPRAAPVRAAIVREGFDTICSAPLYEGPLFLGTLNLYHDRPHLWSGEDLDTVAALAAEASLAIKTAQDYARMASWAAQLQSIQQLGVRLARLTSIEEIGRAIATELDELIDYHNVRVYRLDGEDLIPMAMHGQVGVYHDETPEQLRVRLGEGITGWVARYRIPQYLPDAAHDRRAMTIPGTEDDLEESLLLAPMLFEDRVLGVLVLARLGLHQFSEDELRLLTIYASFAAQAMANAEATEQLRGRSADLSRQLRSQRELLQITESILSTLEPDSLLDGIVERLAEIVAYDQISVDVLDRGTGRLRSVAARGGAQGAPSRSPDAGPGDWDPDTDAVARWVLTHDEPILVTGELGAPPVPTSVSAAESEVADGRSRIIVPLRGRAGATGILRLDRFDPGRAFRNDEFELVKLFAAQVSIALQNADDHRAVEIRARTDNLTGLLNHGAFAEWLERAGQDGDEFGLIMLDLDNFRSVNNELGHQAGDRLLCEIAAALVAAARQSDLVFRYGGDEFVYLLPGTGGDGARQVAERVHQVVASVGGPGSRWAVDGARATASIGYATLPADGRSAPEVLLAADRAAYVAKRSGGDRLAGAQEGLALADEFRLQPPTPVDPPSLPIGAPA